MRNAVIKFRGCLSQNYLAKEKRARAGYLARVCLLFACWEFLSSAESFQNNLTGIQEIPSGILSRVSNSVDPDHAQHSVGHDLGPNCLKRLSAKDS